MNSSQLLQLGRKSALSGSNVCIWSQTLRTADMAATGAHDPKQSNTDWTNRTNFRQLIDRLADAGAFGGALHRQVALELADGGEHVEQQTAGRAAGIDRLVENDEVHLLGGDLGGDLGEVEDRAGEAVEPRHHELVALTDEGQRLAFVAASAAPLLLEELVAAIGYKLVALDVEALPDGRDARVSDFHVS